MFRLGCFITAIAIGLNAFGVHMLEQQLTDTAFNVFDTATRYLIWGGMWFMLLSLAQRQHPLPSTGIRFIGLGILLFCGSLYLYLISQLKWLVMITPLGGLLLIIGFFLCGSSLSKKKSPRKTTRRKKTR